MANKYFKGDAESFKSFLNDLYMAAQEKGPDSPEAIKYEDIKKSVVYISEHMAQDPEEAFHCEDGAIYAHGAIIAGGSQEEGPMWTDEIEEH